MFNHSFFKFTKRKDDVKLLKWWPAFLLLALVPVSIVFNPDGAVTPYLRARGLSSWLIVLISGFSGAAELTFWYIGWSRTGCLIAQWFKEDVELAKKIAGEMKAKGYLDWIKVHTTRKYKKLTEKANAISKGLKAGSYLTFFLFGCWPLPGPRMIADFICGTGKLKYCFLALCLGNFLKTLTLVFAWEGIFYIFEW